MPSPAPEKEVSFVVTQIGAACAGKALGVLVGSDQCEPSGGPGSSEG